MPFIGRTKYGNRIFSEADLNWVTMVCCLKDTGMQIKEIKQYADLCMQGTNTIDERKEMLADHRKQVLKQMEDIKKNLDLIDSKIAVYGNPELAERMYGDLEKTK